MKQLKLQSKSLKEQVRDKDEEMRAKTEEIKRALKGKASFCVSVYLPD